jgi:hypothetical protein
MIRRKKYINGLYSHENQRLPVEEKFGIGF